jgi:hypothetical protein
MITMHIQIHNRGRRARCRRGRQSSGVPTRRDQVSPQIPDPKDQDVLTPLPSSQPNPADVKTKPAFYSSSFYSRSSNVTDWISSRI